MVPVRSVRSWFVHGKVGAVPAFGSELLTAPLAKGSLCVSVQCEWQGAIGSGFAVPVLPVSSQNLVRDLNVAVCRSCWVPGPSCNADFCKKGDTLTAKI